MSMFCYQCQEANKNIGCVKRGVCGKNEDIASLQDALIFSLKGIAAYAYHARELGSKDEQVDAFMHEALFKTLTNVDFDGDRFVKLINETIRLREDLKVRVTAAGGLRRQYF